MIGGIISRCRAVAPPAWSIAALLLIFGLFEVPDLLFGQQPGQAANRPARGYLILASLMLGGYRVAAYHPYFRPNYLRWLKSTPWNVGKPLPLGPVELVPEDGPWIGLIILLGATQPERQSIDYLNIYLFGHTLVLITTFWRTGATGFGYSAAMSLGFVPLLWARPWLNLLVLTGIYLFVHEGLWRALKCFPWETEGILVDLRLVQTTEPNPVCGWFFDRFHRDINIVRAISRVHAFLGCMLGSWWLFVLVSLIRDPKDRIGALMFCTGIVMAVSPLIRLGIYTQGHGPPISFWGRVWTFRWIIPGYDLVFLGPVCSLVAGALTVIVCSNSRVPIEIELSVAAGTTLLVALIAPPRLKRWRLTGQHRLGPTLSESQAASVQKMR